MTHDETPRKGPEVCRVHVDGPVRSARRDVCGRCCIRWSRRLAGCRDDGLVGASPHRAERLRSPPSCGRWPSTLRRPAAAGPVFVGATVLVVLFTVVDFAFCLIPRDGWGPVAAVAVFAICVALAFLGLHPAALAGLLMVAESFRQSADLRIERSLLTGESLSNRLRLGATPRDRLWMSAGPRVSSIPAPSSVPLCGTRGRARSRPRLPTGTCPQRSLQSSA